MERVPRYAPLAPPSAVKAATVRLFKPVRQIHREQSQSESKARYRFQPVSPSQNVYANVVARSVGIATTAPNMTALSVTPSMELNDAPRN